MLLEIHEENDNSGTVVCIARGEGIQRIYPVVKEYKSAGSRILLILGGSLKELELAENRMQHLADELFLAASEESFGPGASVVSILRQLFEVIEKSTHTHYPELVYAIVPEDDGRAILELTKECSVKTIIQSVK